jgi:hypothetical protein
VCLFVVVVVVVPCVFECAQEGLLGLSSVRAKESHASDYRERTTHTFNNKTERVLSFN